jgi:hypothetical protein
MLVLVCQAVISNCGPNHSCGVEQERQEIITLICRMKNVCSTVDVVANLVIFCSSKSLHQDSYISWWTFQEDDSDIKNGLLGCLEIVVQK